MRLRRVDRGYLCVLRAFVVRFLDPHDMRTAMIEITNTIALDENELEFSFIRASGPGGQNVNKVSSAVQMRFDARRSPSLPNDLVLENDDRVYVPPRPTTVGVFGAVYQAGSFVFDSSKTLNDYLRLAGGPERLAESSDIFVVRANGSVISAECVVIAIGSVPATEWLRGSGLTVGDGLECDEFCRAAPGVYAAGDVASWIHPGYRRRLRIEHWMHAVEQGTAAARNLLRGAKKRPGDPEPFAPVPYFWTDQYKVKLQVYGDPDLASGTATIAEGSVDEGRFVALYRKDGIVTAVLGWNAAARLPGYRKLLTDQRTAGSPHPGQPS